MLARILLDPSSVDGGAAPSAPALAPAAAAPAAPNNGPTMPSPLTPHPDLSKPPASPGEAPRAAPIWMGQAEYAAREDRLQKLEAFKAEADRLAEQKEQEHIRLMAEKGQLKEAFDLQQANYQKKIADYANQAKAIESEWLDEKRTTAISDALTGRTFTGAEPAKTAAMVRRLLEGEVEAIRDDRGRPVIRDKATLKPASEYLKERLESPEFAVFFAATNRGGSGTDGARPAAATPKTPGDPNSAFAAAFLAAQADAKNARF